MGAAAPRRLLRSGGGVVALPVAQEEAALRGLVDVSQAVAGKMKDFGDGQVSEDGGFGGTCDIWI